MFFHSCGRRRDGESSSHEREKLQPVEQSVHALHRPDKTVEAVALNALEHALHEQQRQIDHCVRELEREKEKMRVLEECEVVPPHELQNYSLTSRTARTPLPMQCVVCTSAANI